MIKENYQFFQDLIGQKIIGCKSASLCSNEYKIFSLEFDLSLCFTECEMNLSCLYDPSRRMYGFSEDEHGNTFYNSNLKILKGKPSTDYELLFNTEIYSVSIYGRELPNELAGLIKVIDKKTCDFFLFEMEDGSKCYFFFNPYMPQVDVCVNDYYMSGFLNEYEESYVLINKFVRPPLLRSRKSVTCGL